MPKVRYKELMAMYFKKQRTSLRFLVLAGNEAQFRRFCFVADVDAEYVRSANSFKGYTNFLLFVVGTGKERDDYNAIMDEVRYRALCAPGQVFIAQELVLGETMG